MLEMLKSLSFFKNVLLFFLLLTDGIRRCKVHIDRLYVIQFLNMTLMIVFLLFSITSGDISSRWIYLVISFLSGSVIGFYIFYSKVRAYDAQKKLITFEGEWFSLLFYAAIICMYLVSDYMHPVLSDYMRPLKPVSAPQNIEEKDVNWKPTKEELGSAFAELQQRMELQEIESQRVYRLSWTYWINLICWGIISGIFLGRFLKLRSQLKRINKQSI